MVKTSQTVRIFEHPNVVTKWEGRSHIPVVNELLIRSYGHVQALQTLKSNRAEGYISNLTLPEYISSETLRK